MPLPDNGAAWPPPAMSALYRDIRTDDAWYSGDRDRLAALYRGQPTTDTGRRRLWSRDRPAQQPDTRLHIPLPADIASTSADLLFSEPPTFTVAGTVAQDRLTEVAELGGVGNTLLESAEVAAALSGVFLRVTWDQSLAARPLLTTVHPDAAVPEFRWSVLAAVTFWREVASTTETVYRHLERHEQGRIVHALYEGTPDNLGRRVPIVEHPDTADLAPLLTLDGDSIPTGITDLTAAYVPNIKPNRRHRGSPHGRSDYAAPLYDLFDALDETWTSWLRDIRLARARLIVPDGYLRDLGPGQGAAFEDREVWQPLRIPPDEAGGTSAITLSQFGIRVDEHERTAAAIVRQAVQSAGYSAQSFGLGGDTAATATEVVARERRSMITRDKKSRYWAPAVADMLHVMLQLDRVLFTPGLTPERPRVTFGDSVSEDPQSVAQTLALLQQAQAVSIDTKVRMVHPDWDETAVAAERDRILTESGAVVPNPTPAFGPPA